jgi:hypothetical protein
LLAGPAPAAEVYHSAADDALSHGPGTVVVGGAPVALHLYVYGGPAQSLPETRCSGLAGGDELCGWDLAFSATGGVTLAGFVPAPGVAHHLSGGTLLRANAVDPVSPPAGPVHIGTLSVAASGPGSVQVQGLAVGSDLAARSLGPVLVAFTGADADGDTVDDGSDNCIEVANPDQRNVDRDGGQDAFGNACDPDFNNDGVVSAADYLILRAALNTADPASDLNGDGTVSAADYLVLRRYLGRPPGPSGLSGGP